MKKQYYTLKEALSIARDIDPRIPKTKSIPRWRVSRCIPGPVAYSYTTGRIGLYTEELIISLLVTAKLNKDRGFSIYEIAQAYATFRNTGMGPDGVGQLTIITPTNEMSTDRAYEAFMAYKQVRQEVEATLRERGLVCNGE
jgi:hypothetical protein